ncbi:hypothetical protein FOXG_08685 [Fusarium oxysporum f. sp. lycopersici 4287]|uniref:Uncharacterized protein n=2 Tax=Fusarium oxysporum TaxID=5507 RepID=A0A0J9WNM9_FUSO4|nr:hypothetical protein FOXG_08685 [Fusarium oxysporum f. sp. lycopersici 4287]KNB07562.1 hypothetical protein FOXG_08685 [Fusarium oxysporum f. sp. lycopersici 4287]
MCIIFLTPVDCTGPRKITEKAKELLWSQLASDIERNNVKFRDLAPECGICREDVTVLPFDYKLQNGKGETHRGVILPRGHIFGASCFGTVFVHPMCGHYFHGLYMPSNKPDMDIIPPPPPTLNNGGIIADYCDECAINNTVDELTDNLYNLLPEESKGRYAVSLAYGGETFPLPLMRNCLEMRAPAAFRSFFAQYQRRLDKYESSTKLWNNCCHAGAPVKVRDLGSQ